MNSRERTVKSDIRRLGLLLLALAPVLAKAASLEECREARRKAPSDAIELCTQALDAAADADAAFEVRMHLIELHTASGNLDLAAERLDEARRTLDKVRDPLAQHRLARRQGMLAYRNGDMARALTGFLEGLAAARQANDLRAVAVSENDLGVIYRRLGEYQQALAHWLASLENKRASGDGDLAATEDNIGNLYRDLREPEQARVYLERALMGHRDKGRVLLAAHTTEDLGLLAADAADFGTARALLDEAWAVFERERSRLDQLRLARHRAELEWRADGFDAAAHWIDRAAAISQQLKQALPVDMMLLRARLQAHRGNVAVAYSALGDYAAANGETDEALAKEWAQARAQWARQLGRYADALNHTEVAHAAEVQLLERRHGERMDALRVRFEFSELEHERDRLQRANVEQALVLQRRRNQLMALALGSIVLLAGVWIVFQRRLYGQRLQAQAMETQHRRQVEDARRVADSLRADLRSLRVALDQSSEPLLVIDAAGLIQLASTAAVQLLRRDQREVRGAHIADLLGAATAAELQAALERLGSGETASPIQIVSGSDGNLPIRALSLSLEEELGVLSLTAETATATWVDSMNRAHAHWEQSANAELADENIPSVASRRAIVELMQVCLDIWERSTCSTRLELAEKSGIWRITIDEGRLRTRTLNRYLEVASLPARPRWREVLRTAYFVLAECKLDPTQRELINRRIGHLQEQMRGSLVGSGFVGANRVNG